MTLDQARADWQKEHKRDDFDALTHEEQMEILTEAVKRERAERAGTGGSKRK